MRVAIPALVAALALATPARAQDSAMPAMLEEAPPPPPGPNAPRPRTMPRDRTLMWVGGLLTLVGGSALLVGSAMVEARHPGDGNGSPSSVAFFGGLGAFSVGVPMFLWGAKRIPIAPPVTPSLGPRGVGLAGAF
jgi:hypothetical protein